MKTMLNLEQFRASKGELPLGHCAMPRHVAEMVQGMESTLSAVLIYEAETIIFRRTDGDYYLNIGRNEWRTDDLAELEGYLFSFYATD